MRCSLLVLLGVLTALPAEAADGPRVVHVYVALADNENQGIVPVPPKLGNGEDPGNNLYWGAAYGVRTYFKRHPDWAQVAVLADFSTAIVERVVFKHRTMNAFVVADAY